MAFEPNGDRISYKMEQEEETKTEDDLLSIAFVSGVNILTERRTDKIQIEFSNNGYLIFDLEDAKTLRTSHRMVGTAIGTSPTSPAQNDSLSLPLLLFAEQVAVLLEYGYACLVRLCNETPGDSDRELFREYIAQQKDIQAEVVHKTKIDEQLNKAETIARGRVAKKRKLEQSQPGTTARLLKVSSADMSAVLVTEEQIEEVRRELRLSKPAAVADDAISVETWLLTPRLFSPNYERIDAFDFPITVQQRLRLTVFRDLWRKGYFLTPGIKFGCDFLVYPGDPTKFHATCMAICVKSDQSLTPVELAAYSRVATQVKKTVLICSVAADSDAPYYLSLNWWKG